MKLAKVPVSEASETIPKFMRMDLVNRNAKISKGDGCRLVPILEEKEAEVERMGYELVEGFAHSRDRTPPQERILNIADEIIVVAEGRIREMGPREDILPHLIGTPEALTACEKIQERG